MLQPTLQAAAAGGGVRGGHNCAASGREEYHCRSLALQNCRQPSAAETDSTDTMLFEKLLFFTEQGNANPIYSDTDNSELGGVTNTFVETAPDALYGELYDREFPPPPAPCLHHTIPAAAASTRVEPDTSCSVNSLRTIL